MKTASEKLVYAFDEACEIVNISRAQGYREVAAGTLETFLDGRRRKVTRKALERYVERKASSGNIDGRKGRRAA